jgi:hypothetical protein
MSTTSSSNAPASEPDIGSLVLGTGFTLASLILFPAIAQSLGLGPSLTSAMRIVLMKAAAKV